MIAHLRGALSHKDDESAVIDVAGVGYLVHMTSIDLRALPPLGDETFVHVLTHVRDGAVTLFGFAEAGTRLVFSRLIGITGVGPKMALSILSTLSLQELWDAVHLGNTASLQRIPGVGPKTARRLSLELKDLLEKVGLVPPTQSKRAASAAPAPAPAAGPWTDLRSALVNLGYNEARVEEVLASLRHQQPDASFDALLREALTELR